MAMKSAKKSKKTTAKKATGKKSVVLELKHEGHANHLCELVAKRQMAKVAKASAGAAYLCHICGRAAKDPKSLCEPVEI